MATLTVTIKEEIVLNDTEHGSETIFSDTNIVEFFERIVRCPNTSETTLLTFGSAAGGNTFIDTSCEYVRVTNNDATNFVTLRILGNSEEYFVKIDPKGSYILFNDQMDANASGSATASLANIDEIKAQADTATCQVAVFAAA